MRTKKTSSRTPIMVIIAAIIIVGGFFIFKQQHRATNTGGKRKTVQLSSVIWKADSAGTWSATNGTAPACPNPVFKVSPVDVDQATGILYPGQYRNNDYKAHGAFRFDHNQSNEAFVRLPMDAKLVNASRYRENGETQYLLEFQNPCGIAIRFDHLLTLAPRFQAIADKLPAAQDNDSRTTAITDQPAFPAGELLATAIGFEKSKNYTVDFGVYDLRQPNKISQNSAWAAIHHATASQADYGVCWIDWLPSADKTRAQQITPRSTDEKAASDYCANPTGGTTMQYRGGLPQ